MRVRVGSGWQMVLADLSMILFMVTAAGISDAPPDVPASLPPLRLPALGEPVAVWRPGPTASPLRAWLAGQGNDPRLRLTIVGSLGARDIAITLATGAGRSARVLLEPGPAEPPFAALTFDQPPPLFRRSPDRPDRPEIREFEEIRR